MECAARFLQIGSASSNDELHVSIARTGTRLLIEAYFGAEDVDETAGTSVTADAANQMHQRTPRLTRG